MFSCDIYRLIIQGESLACRCVKAYPLLLYLPTLPPLPDLYPHPHLKWWLVNWGALGREGGLLYLVRDKQVLTRFYYVGLQPWWKSHADAAIGHILFWQLIYQRGDYLCVPIVFFLEALFLNYLDSCKLIFPISFYFLRLLFFLLPFFLTLPDPKVCDWPQRSKMAYHLHRNKWNIVNGSPAAGAAAFLAVSFGPSRAPSWASSYCDSVCCYLYFYLALSLCFLCRLCRFFVGGERPATLFNLSSSFFLEVNVIDSETSSLLMLTLLIEP